MAEPSHRRGQVVLDRVLDTTLELLAERAYSFSVDEVAERAGVHKTTIYRRWPTKAAIVAAAAGRLAATEVPATRTDDPVDDLTRLAVGVARVLRRPVGNGALRAVLAAAADDPELVATARGLLTGRYRLAVDMVRDAIAAGRVRDDVDPTLVWEAIVNPLHVRALLGMPASDRTARALVAVVLDGAGVARVSASASGRARRS
ncbi:MAG TPA: TetR/AcrR family transcriptional regulator [Ilumatobacteraceae bacterium]|nr:TetR/AcrR family transcriptional regulator [Ilumatobacteraceae bacterium]